jgi:hypothetical protein
MTETGTAGPSEASEAGTAWHGGAPSDQQEETRKVRLSLPLPVLQDALHVGEFQHRDLSSLVAEALDRFIFELRIRDDRIDSWLTQQGSDGRRHVPLAARSLGVTPPIAPIETKTPASPSAENPSPAAEEEAD